MLHYILHIFCSDVMSCCLALCSSMCFIFAAFMGLLGRLNKYSAGRHSTFCINRSIKYYTLTHARQGILCHFFGGFPGTIIWFLFTHTHRIKQNTRSVPICSMWAAPVEQQHSIEKMVVCTGDQQPLR